MTGILVLGTVVVPTCLAEYGIGNIILAGSVAFYNGRHHILRYILIVSKKLLGVLWQTVTAITETGVVVVCTDTWVKTDTVNDGGRVKTFDLAISVQFIEVGYAKGKISVGK